MVERWEKERKACFTNAPREIDNNINIFITIDDINRDHAARGTKLTHSSRRKHANVDRARVTLKSGGEADVTVKVYMFIHSYTIKQ